MLRKLRPLLFLLQFVIAGLAAAFLISLAWPGVGNHLRDGLRARGIVELLTTADGTTADMVRNGSVEGAMGSFTFGTGVAKAQSLRVPDQPLLCAELWGGWFDHWGEQHHVRSAASMIGTVEELLAEGGSVSLYMAHGGTNFGLWAGANHDRVLQPTVTSYDSDAPIGEDGSQNDKFHALRAAFAPFHDGDLPPIPAAPRRQPAVRAVKLLRNVLFLDGGQEVRLQLVPFRTPIVDLDSLGMEPAVLLPHRACPNPGAANRTST